ncbi:MAG: ferredoxin [Spirochaetia bacterium]|nr:ferredoxin [Spirochaetia bacterium]MCF7941634.1 ferredoxin [Spirochaetia bacterium]
MNIHIDTDKCAGCGLCSHIAPTLFFIDGYHACLMPDSEELIKDDEILRCRVQEILETCPLSAITIEYDEQDQPITNEQCADHFLFFAPPSEKTN